MQIAKQARKEGRQKFFRIFKQEENELYIASSAKWHTQLKGLVELEKRCLDLMQEVELLSDRQEVLAGLVVSKRDMQKEPHQKYQAKGCRGINSRIWRSTGHQKLWRSYKRSIC